MERATFLMKSYVLLTVDKFNLQLAELDNHCKTLSTQFQDISKLSLDLITKIVDGYIANWNWCRKLYGSEIAIEGAGLDTIEGWCKSLAESLWTTREQAKHMEQSTHEYERLSHFKQSFSDVHGSMTSNLGKLFRGAFIIEHQPPQVMKINTRFAAKVRFLVSNTFGIRIANPVVNVSFLSEVQVAQVQQVTSMYQITGGKCGEILNNSCSLEFDEKSNQIVANFREMKLKAFKRAGKKLRENVTDEKFAFWFQSSLRLGDLNIDFSAISLPVVVVVHCTQEPQAWATVFWDNAFAVPGRKCFDVPEGVSWKEFRDALNQKFTAINDRELTTEILSYLGEKMFDFTQENIPEDCIVSWSMFCKNNLLDRDFTFWHWFYAAMKLTREHLLGGWANGHIHGFISKAKVEEYLIGCPHGTFMLRFSDSVLGKWNFRLMIIAM